MKKILVQRFSENPLIIPKDVPWLKFYPKFWRGVNNCGVIYEPETKLFKMLFRGGTRIFSQIGYAESEDGIRNWRIYPRPVLRFTEKKFWQGQTLAGIEDPRIIKWIDGDYYIFATACSIVYHLSNGRNGQMAIWKTKNFQNFEWVGMPIKGESKNAAIFPEPINGYVYLLYRRMPDIWLARTNDLTLKSGWEDKKLLLTPQQIYRSRITGQSADKIGLAGPPIKTNKGWLVIFHAKFGKGEWNKMRYDLGLMVLDLNNPTKIVYLHPEPILWPEKSEEIFGLTPNVCFSCATIDYGDKIYLYWGGADTVICGGYLLKSDLSMCY